MSWKLASSGVHVSRKLGLNRHYRIPAKKERPAPASCSEDQRARQSCSLVPARAMIIIMGCPAPAIFEGRPAPLLPYCEARRSGRTTRERGGERRGEWEKNAPVLTSRYGTPRIRVHSPCALYAHYIGMPISEIPGSVRARRSSCGGPYLSSSIGILPS